MHLQEDRYIAIGCLGISKEASTLPDEVWSSPDLQTWSGFQESSVPTDRPDLAFHLKYLATDVQEALLQTFRPVSLQKLLNSQWVKLEFIAGTSDANQGTIRVYLLPDDLRRRSVDRSIPALWKARQTLLNRLDYSLEAWTGASPVLHTGGPLRYGIESAETVGDDTTLLNLFNSIASPKPNPSLVDDEYCQDAMKNLLESSVPGLESELYSYQRASAALMVQRESQPGLVLDPRLLHAKDRCGLDWYFDPIAGTVLLEPRYYDGVSGGILAEEMGAGKTIICLALILATKDLPTKTPAIYNASRTPRRKTVASLSDMAASAATRHSIPWKLYFDSYAMHQGDEYTHCIDALRRNPGHYFIPPPPPRRMSRHPQKTFDPPKKLYHSSVSLVVVPNNLVAQWKQEISKHTSGIKLIVLMKNDMIPCIEDILDCDIILFAQSRFELMMKEGDGISESPLSSIHFKRCIVDEGHKLGNSKIGARSNLLIGLDTLKTSSRWIVTGTPSQGLFGVNSSKENSVQVNRSGDESNDSLRMESNESSTEMEKKDLERIGSIASLYLKIRPWANTSTETEDTMANWNAYMMLPRHSSKGQGRWDSLRLTLNSVIIRHPLDEVSALLPTVEEKIVILDGSYQDQLSLNISSMMIIFNAVQSQRTDQDYLFHVKQKPSLMQIVHNLRQASFFGGSFFTLEEIIKGVEVAEEFLEKKKVSISADDEALLRDAITFGHLVAGNKLRNLANVFHDMPVCVENFPGDAGQHWSLGGEGGNPTCTSANLLNALKRCIYNAAGEPEAVNSLLNGGLIQAGVAERATQLATEASDKKSQTFARNNIRRNDGSDKNKSKSSRANGPTRNKALNADSLPGPLQLAKITSTISSKLSYLIDGILQHSDDEKIIVFYENENVAWYLAGMLEVLQIEHLIYAKSLSVKRKAQYVHAFNYDQTFRVVLMDLSQAAFGLDMKAASRIYFINPVLNPQVEAQAIGRARRISQQKPVSVETLILKDSLDEVILDRKKHMTQAEHRRVKSILDVRPIYNWIKNARIVALPKCYDSYESQMAILRHPHKIFGRGLGKPLHLDDVLLLVDKDTTMPGSNDFVPSESPLLAQGVKRSYDDGAGNVLVWRPTVSLPQEAQEESVVPPARKVRFA